MEDIRSYLTSTVSDDFLSKDERRGFKDLLAGRTLSKSEAAAVHQTIFELAKAKVTDGKIQFLLDWLRQTTSAVTEAASVPSHAYFSPGETCRKAIIDQIAAAAKTIRIAVFTISDDTIVRAILAARQKGRSIRILTDNDKSLDQGSDIHQLIKAGISVRMDTTPAHMHHKFMITDDTALLTGSYNWTSSAARVNYENVIVTRDEELVTSFAKEFEKLWTGTSF